MDNNDVVVKLVKITDKGPKKIRVLGHFDGYDHGSRYRALKLTMELNSSLKYAGITDIEAVHSDLPDISELPKTKEVAAKVSEPKVIAIIDTYYGPIRIRRSQTGAIGIDATNSMPSNITAELYKAQKDVEFLLSKGYVNKDISDEELRNIAIPFIHCAFRRTGNGGLNFAIRKNLPTQPANTRYRVKLLKLIVDSEPIYVYRLGTKHIKLAIDPIDPFEWKRKRLYLHLPEAERAANYPFEHGILGSESPDKCVAHLVTILLNVVFSLRGLAVEKIENCLDEEESRKRAAFIEKIENGTASPSEAEAVRKYDAEMNKIAKYVKRKISPLGNGNHCEGQCDH